MFYEDLIETIKKQCFSFSGYNEITLKDLVVSYTLINNIYVDTKAWDDLIDSLWGDLNKDFLIESFNNKEEFDNYMAYDLV